MLLSVQPRLLHLVLLWQRVPSWGRFPANWLLAVRELPRAQRTPLPPA
jgi:hypothetical protein